MTVNRNKEGALTDEEKKIVKALLAKRERNQDIQALINIGRKATINSARITEVKNDSNIDVASDSEVEYFKIRKKSYDHKTGLNLIDDERLIRAREAMILAVQVFNSPSLHFKTEVFAMLANVAWTYLFHEYCKRNNIQITDGNGYTKALSKIIKGDYYELSRGVKDNIRAIKDIRDSVEHKLLGRADATWSGLFQACCLNFDKTMCDMFGEKLSLSHDLSFAIQFTKMNIEHLSTLNEYEIPSDITAVDARLKKGMTEEQLSDLEYQFKVIYTFDSAAKSEAHFQFISPDSEDGKQIHNILVKHEYADKYYPYKPRDVVSKIKEQTNKEFSMHNHSQAWRKYNVRPSNQSPEPWKTESKYCIYHHVHKDYTYSDKWIKFLTDVVNNDEKFSELKRTNIKK